MAVKAGGGWWGWFTVGTARVLERRRVVARERRVGVFILAMSGLVG